MATAHHYIFYKESISVIGYALRQLDGPYCLLYPSSLLKWRSIVHIYINEQLHCSFTEHAKLCNVLSLVIWRGSHVEIAVVGSHSM